MKRYALVVAGGSGTRMGNETPKQFLPIQELPILMHTLRVFHHLENRPEIILVLPKSEVNNWKTLCNQYNFDLQYDIVDGGDTRQQSVRNGLAKINDDNALVAIHDGVRPLVSKEIIEDCFNAAEHFGSGCASVVPKDSIRMKEANDSWSSINRDRCRMMQTPQTFRLDILKRAYNMIFDDSLTDDASIVEKSGHKIKLVAGVYSNIKITTPDDLVFAEAILSKQILDY